MTDLTPLFKQCVEIVQSEYKTSPDIKTYKQPPYILKDTFIEESHDFYKVIINLNQFINEMKSNYLAINDDTKVSGSLTIEDKNKIDEEFNFKVQQMYKQLNHLEAYETKREKLIPSKQQSTGWFSFLEDEPNDQEIYFETISTHRKQILRFLMDSLNIVSKKFEVIQQRRISRERQLNLLNFQNFEDDEDLNVDDNFPLPTLDQIQQSPADDDKEYQLDLSQQQIQELELENQEFLNMKTNQLKQVEKVQQSIVDIINIQNELSFKLQSQGDQIGNLMDTHAQVETEVKMGNKTLNQATKKNKRGANMLVTLCIVLGLLMLLIDYISIF